MLGTRHRSVPMRSEDIASQGPGILSGIDEPFADSSLLPVHLLSRAAREHVTVALAGDGADELFAGYRRYSADRWLGRWRRLPPVLRHGVLEPILRRIPEDRSARLGDMARRARKVLAADGLDDAARQFAMARIFAAAEKLRLAPGLADHVDSGYARLCTERDRQGGRDPLDHQLRVDLALGLPDDMLTKVDRASMAHGLEVRVPYLDHRLVEHVVRLPSRLKRQGGRSKVALLDVFGASIPRAVRRRPKLGFDAPLSAWLRGPLRGLVRDTLAPTVLRRAGLLDPVPVDALVTSHERGEADHAWRIWSLVVLCDWSNRVGLA
jgi:asparagine synthase (glutamine-hydrolysing)